MAMGTSRRVFRRRRRGGKKKAPLSKQVKMLKKKVNKSLQKEARVYSAGAVDQQVASIVGAPNTQLIQSLATGQLVDVTGGINSNVGSYGVRIGNILNLKRLRMRYAIYSDNNSNYEINLVPYNARVMVVYEKTPATGQLQGTVAGTFPALDELFDVAATATRADIFAMQTQTQTSLRILSERYHALPLLFNSSVNTDPVNCGNNALQHGYFDVDLSKLPPSIWNSNNSDADGNQAQGRLFVVAFCDNINANTNGVKITYTLKLDYSE